MSMQGSGTQACQAVAAFEQWLQEVGIKHSAKLELKVSDGVCKGWGCVSVSPISDGEKLVVIPKAAV